VNPEVENPSLPADAPSRPLPALSEIRSPVWWRFLGVATMLVAILMAVVVWKINCHLSRVELARVFTMAMTPARPAVARPVAVQQPSPVRRFRPVPVTRKKDEAPPFSLNRHE
jgi:hypothetical protein